MKIADVTPAIVQQPNVERGAQAAATGAQIAQQAFAQQLQRMGALRPEQVQAAQPDPEAHPAGVRADEHGERQRRRPAGMAERRRTRGDPDPARAPADPARLDVRI